MRRFPASRMVSQHRREVEDSAARQREVVERSESNYRRKLGAIGRAHVRLDMRASDAIRYSSANGTYGYASGAEPVPSMYQLAYDTLASLCRSSDGAKSRVAQKIQRVECSDGGKGKGSFAHLYRHRARS